MDAKIIAEANRRAAEADHAYSLRREARMAEIVRQLKVAPKR